MVKTDDLSSPVAAVRLELLGVPRLMRGDMLLQALERRDAALLALLATEGAASRSRVATLLWSDSDARRASNNLRQRLFRLKRSAGHDLVVGDGVLSLAPDVLHDLSAGVVPDQAELLGSTDYTDCGALGDWVDAARERWRVARRQALADAASRLEGEGRIAQALELAERLALDDPSAEHVHRRVMRLHYLRGDRAAALAAFERCTSALRQQLDAHPGRETLELAATIERSGGLREAPPSPQRPLPMTLRRPPRLVARDAEWMQLQDAIGRRATVLVEGEPGIGKSRLLHDFATARDWPPPVGARPGDESVPYALAARWLDSLCARFTLPGDPALLSELARVLPRLADTSHPPSGVLEPARLRQAVQTLLAGWDADAHRVDEATGLGTVLDDLQFADAASLDLLLSLAGAPSSAWCWLLACRSGAAPTTLQLWLDEMPASRVAGVVLQPLDEAGVVALLDSLSLPGMDAQAWAAPLIAHCGGQPFHLIDALTALHLQGQHDFSGAPRLPSPSAQQQGAVARRLEQLAGAAEQLAHVAATAGQDFSVELAAHVLGCAPVALAPPWRTLERHGLFRSDGFAHDLVRQAALAAVPPAIARTVHRQVAQWLVANTGSSGLPRAGRIAAHWEAAQEWGLAAESFEAAAREARIRAARRDEARALAAAARCHRAGGLTGCEDAAFQCDARGVALTLALDSADLAFEQAQALVERAATDRQRATALEVRALVHNERVEPEAALADAMQAQTLAARAAAPRLALLAAQRAATALMRLGRPDEAVAALQAHADELSALEDGERLYWLSDHATALDYADRRVEAVQAFDRVVDQAQRLGDWSAASEASGNQAIALMYLNRMGESIAASERAIECSRRAGSERGNLLIDEMTLIGSLRDMGRFDEYLQRAEPLPQALRDAGYAVWAFNAENDLAVCFVWLGRPELARRVLTPIGDDVVPMMRAARLFVEARLRRGRPLAPGEPSAAQIVRQAHALIEDSALAGRSYLRLRVALELARDDAPADALHRVASIEAEAVQREQRMLALHALVLRTELLTRLGDVDRAAEAAGQLLEACLHEGTPPGLYAPEVWWVAHQGLSPIDPQRALLALQRAHDWIRQTAMPHLPEVFHQSFLERNPVNAAIVAAWRRACR
jgi:DNA-binding SARP family transcriptional activator